MRKTLSFLLVSLLVAACGGSDKVQRDQQQYEVVQEGSASGTAAALTPMTGTNADTTTAFTIDPSLASAPGAPPGTIAGSLPEQPYGGVGSPGYVPPAPAAAPPRPAVPPSGMTSGSVTPQPAQAPRIVVQRSPAQTATQPPAEPVEREAEPEPQPVPTDTGIAPPPAPPTQTTTTTTAPPAEKPKEPAPPQQEAEPEPEPETEEPPPPPPPM